ncbi:MAG: hypothetical protein JXQ73_20795 [Phycisphaerae bacterium]|nr:hypothetical protein [Phycisphaerae bacterium]
MEKRLPLLGLLAVALSPALALADPPYWHRVVVDSDPNGAGCGKWCSLAFDPNGNPLIAYDNGFGTLVLTCPGPQGIDASWLTETVNTQSLGPCILKIDPDGDPAVAFVHGGSNDPNDLYHGKYSLRYASRSASAWDLSEPLSPVVSLEVWELGGGPREPGGLAYDSSGRAWLSYIFNGFAGGDVRWATVFDPNLHPPLDIKNATFVGGLGQAYLAVGPSGLPSVVYWLHESGEAYYKGVKYACYDPNYHTDPNWPEYHDPKSWIKQEVYPDPNGSMEHGALPMAFTFAPDGTPRVVCLQRQFGTEKDWIVFTAESGWDMSLVTDQIKDGVTGGPDCSSDLCLAYRYDGNPEITFYDARDPNARMLKYAWLDPNDPNNPHGVWQIRAIDWIGDVGKYHSLANDPNGLPAVAYYDATEHCLVYAVTSDQPDTYALTIHTEGGGTVTKDPEEDPNWAAYVYGTTVTLTPVPNENRSFARWLLFDPNYPGDANYAAQDDTNTLVLVMDRDREVGAVFICSIGSGAAWPMILISLGLVALKFRWRLVGAS